MTTSLCQFASQNLRALTLSLGLFLLIAQAAPALADPEVLSWQGREAYGRADYAVAAQAFEELLRELRQTVGERHPDTLTTMNNLGLTHRDLGPPVDAAKLSERFVERVEWQRSQPGLPAANRQATFAKYAASYRFFSSIHGQSTPRRKAFG